MERGQKPVQHISKIYSGFSCQEFRDTVVHGINNFKIKRHLDSSYLQNLNLSTEIKRVYSELSSYLNIATVSGLFPQNLLR